MLDALLDGYRRHDRRALARLLSFLARGEHLEQILGSIPAAVQPGRVIAVTGSAGVGKSTLVGRLIEVIRDRGLSVAVLACDPQSPVSGGALLGDRFRMPNRPDDEGVYIRSLATPGGHGSLAQHIAIMVRLVEGFGFDVVLVETVGAGQGDTTVRDLADVVVLLLQPETGDDLQWEKAGVLEVADIVVIHKADLPGSEHVESQVRIALDLAGNEPATIVRVSARSGEGVQRLWELVVAKPLRRCAAAPDSRDLLRLAQDVLASRFATAEAQANASFGELLAHWRQGRLAPAEAATSLLRLLMQNGIGQ